jgi:hypothetical protein
MLIRQKYEGTSHQIRIHIHYTSMKSVITCLQTAAV